MLMLGVAAGALNEGVVLSPRSPCPQRMWGMRTSEGNMKQHPGREVQGGVEHDRPPLAQKVMEGFLSFEGLVGCVEMTVKRHPEVKG